ncbi:MAG TPA: hypothetical protein VGG89_00190 [Candidatus Baltobacteraceae bacterium]
MTLRRLPGAIVLGLVAALVTHAVLFGGEHAWGGAYHSALLQFTLAAVTGLTAAAGALLWTGAACAADGTVLAARMRSLLPGWFSVAVCGTGWYVLGECLETAHAGVPLLAVLAIVALSAWLVLRFAAIALRALAEIVLLVVRLLDVQRQRRVAFELTRRIAPRYAQDDKAWRRFTRPPPVEFALTRA